MLIQLIGSAVAISVLVVIAAWARIARPMPPLDAATLGALLVQEFPDRHPRATWISADGAGALARDGDTALVLWRRGDGYVARDVAWPIVAGLKPSQGRVVIRLADARPVFAVAHDVWPPRELVA